jgi:NACHT domain-containing protein/pentapeptide repeat protein
VTDPHDTIRVVRGGPGSGKSTFARKLAADLAQSGTIRVLFLPLQRFRVRDKLIDAIGEALGEAGAQAFAENPLKQKDFATQERRLLLIFDGLDELTKPGDIGDQETKLFLQELNGCRVFALVTGRTAAVHSHRDVLRLSGPQELEVLRFLIFKAELDLERADLEAAVLRGANMSNARFQDANLSNADLTHGILHGADLREAKGLTQEQLDQTSGNERTMLPPGLRAPRHWQVEIRVRAPRVVSPQGLRTERQ